MKQISDNLTFEDPNNREKVTFNKYTFLEILKGCIINYTDKDIFEAEELIKNSYLFSLPKSYDDVVFITHEHEYHWSMVIAYGENYWQNSKIKISSEIPEDYDQWEKGYIKKNNLKKVSYEYL
ncbi:hypothetical protein [Aquimarina sp. RZ0]|uniref:hypothetical protein n=1 Tax=Aquimarina sp. RZ0 TaxID=2607730 RepID=UPI0011F204FE|nr:hypothetical protein [Aquimarina sp. RZ0]KAA1246352.1 hypothetical protein F0000_07860 [Aquimarina sp. RZ0]